MGVNMIYGKEATIEDICRLHEKYGFEFIVEDGVIKDVVHQ